MKATVRIDWRCTYQEGHHARNEHHQIEDIEARFEENLSDGCQFRRQTTARMLTLSVARMRMVISMPRMVVAMMSRME